MERTKDSSRSKHKRERSRERSERNPTRRSASRVDPRDVPRTTVLSPSVGVDDDYDDEYDDRPRRPSGSRGKGQPYVEYTRVRENPQPYDARHQPSGREVGESSSTYNKSHDTRRPSTRYHSGRGRDREEERTFAPAVAREDPSLTERFQALQVGEDDNYALSSQRQGETSSYNTKYVDSTQIASSTSIYPSQSLDAAPLAAPGDPFIGRTPASTEYHQPQAYDTTSSTSVYPSGALGTSQTDYTTSQYYPTTQHLSPPQPSYAPPALSAYESSQPSNVISNARQQTNLQPRGTTKAQQKLDASFFVRKHDYKKFFKVGKVFMTLWSEQFGSSAEQGSFISDVIFGEKVYSKVRRFIVVREGAGNRSASCLPITSYSGNGLGKTGIQVEEHGFIYSKQQPPPVVHGMCSKALKVHLSRGAPELAHPSLVNYGKVHNVEGNWKVKDVGDLDSDSRKNLLRYFRRVFRLEDDDIPEATVTPLPKDAVLAHVGERFGSYPSVPAHGAHQTTTTAQQHFTSTSPPDGYPPTTAYDSAGYARGPTAYQYPASTHTSTYATGPHNEIASYQGSIQGTASYPVYTVAMAPGRTVPATSYYSQEPAASDYYSQRTTTNPQSGGDSAYRTYEPQVQQSWSPVGPTTSTTYPDAYGYSTAGSAAQASAAAAYQDPNRQYSSVAEGAADTVYARPSGYRESVIAEGGAERDIQLPSLAEAEALRERKRRDSKGAEGNSSSHRKRRDRDDHRRR